MNFNSAHQIMKSKQGKVHEWKICLTVLNNSLKSAYIHPLTHPMSTLQFYHPVQLFFTFKSKVVAAVSCTTIPYCAAGAGLGLGLTGKPGRAWVGTWWWWCVGFFKCCVILPGCWEWGGGRRFGEEKPGHWKDPGFVVVR